MQLRKPAQEDTVQLREPHPASVLTPQDRDLMPQGHVLGSEPVRLLETGYETPKQIANKLNHSQRITEDPSSFQADDVFGSDTLLQQGGIRDGVPNEIVRPKRHIGLVLRNFINRESGLVLPGKNDIGVWELQT